MDELFGNLIYLIPIALIIFRVLSGIAGAKKKQQQPPQTPDADDAELDPEVRELLRRFMTDEPERKASPNTNRPPAAQWPKSAPARPAPPQPPVQDNRPHWERGQASALAARPVSTPPKPPKKQPLHRPVPAAAPAFNKLPPETASVPAAPLKSPQAVAYPAGAGGTAGRTVSFLPSNLSPLQQGFVWAELLGPPKAL